MEQAIASCQQQLWLAIGKVARLRETTSVQINFKCCLLNMEKNHGQQIGAVETPSGSNYVRTVKSRDYVEHQTLM